MKNTSKVCTVLTQNPVNCPKELGPGFRHPLIRHERDGHDTSKKRRPSRASSVPRTLHSFLDLNVDSSFHLYRCTEDSPIHFQTLFVA